MGVRGKAPIFDLLAWHAKNLELLNDKTNWFGSWCYDKDGFLVPLSDEPTIVDRLPPNGEG